MIIQYTSMRNGLRSNRAEHGEPFSSEGWSNGCDEIIFVFIWITTNNQLLKRRTKQMSFLIKQTITEILHQTQQ